MEKTVFIFIRHAEAEKNLKEITGGKGESLTNKGRKQARELAERIRQMNLQQPVLVISSNMIQVQETAMEISEMLSLQYIVTKKLNPVGMGDVDGKSKAELKETRPELSELLDKWHNREIEAIDLEIPGREHPRQFWNRIMEYLKSICTGGTKIVVCTRSIMVLIYNYIHGNSPERGGGYMHKYIPNCEMLLFCMDANGILGEVIMNGDGNR